MYRDNGKENGNYYWGYIGLYWGYIRVMLGLKCGCIGRMEKKMETNI